MHIDGIRPRLEPYAARPLKPEAPPSVDGAPQLIIPSAEDMQLEMDSAMWARTGTVARVSEQGTKVLDLGNGIVRKEFADGKKTIDGTKRLGTPVHRVLYPDGRETWQVDYPQVARGIYTDLEHVKYTPTSTATLQNAVVTHYAPGPKLNEMTEIAFTDGRGTFRVFSDGPLDDAIAGNMAAAIAGAPEKAFENSKELFVLGELGAAKDEMGRTTGSMAGFALYESGALFFARERLANREDAEGTMWHEAGHILDRQSDRASERIKDDQQVPVFGYGKLIMEGDEVAVDASDFVTKYASTNYQEDFAEIHRVALELRADYNETHPGTDFFTLSDKALEPEIDHLSPSIQRRLRSVVRIYQDS